jgi:hypothetical protein
MTRSLTTLLKWLCSAIGHFVLWTIWLGLTATLIVLIGIACSHELTVPNSVVQLFRDRMAIAGLRFTFDRAQFDLRGHVLIDKLQIFSDSFEEPLVSCASLYVRIDPWALAAGTLQIDSITGHQLNFYVPTMLSPSGQTEAVISNLEFAIIPGNSGLTVQRLVGRAGKLAITGHGNISGIRASVTKRKNAAATADHLLTDYLNTAKLLARWQGKLEVFEDPTLRLSLVSQPLTGTIAQIALSARAADLTSKEFALPANEKFIRLRGIRLTTTLPLSPPSEIDWSVHGEVEATEDSRGTSIHGLACDLKGGASLGNKPRGAIKSLQLSASDVTAHKATVKGLVVRADVEAWPTLRLEIGSRIADENWSVRARGNPQTGALEASLSGIVSAGVIDFVDDQAKKNFADLLIITDPVPARATVTLGEHWKLQHATAHFDARNVTARDVALARAVADIDFDGHSLTANNITLQQASNLAHGSYWMDTQTRDYRFLLTGVLRPNGIDGWFHDWWPRFWSRFDFTQAAPVADIDDQGRWGAPHLSNLFIHVEVDHPKINDVPFDQVRTSLFIRPDYYDAPVFFARRGKGEARGHFTRSVDLDQGDFKWMDFDVKTTLPLDVAKIFGDDGTDIVDPFVFSQPPDLHIVGRLEGDASPNGPHQNVTVDVDSTGDFRFFDFPLSDLRCEAVVKDRTISVSNLKVGFAGGTATGHALVTGKEPDRHLKFDADLRSANLGQAIHVVEEYSEHLKGLPTTGPSAFQERLTKGKLDLHASAEGGYHNLLSFVGAGHAELHNGELGEINLLGALSAALRGNSVLGFTSWNLDTAKSDFTLDHDKLTLLTFQLTGPTAKIDGKGTVSMSTKTIDANVKFYPFEEGKTLLANAVGFVLTPVTTALSLKLSGSLSKPKWFFEYGPTDFLRKIASGVTNTNPSAIAPEPAPAPVASPTSGSPYPPPPPPPPFLRRRE